MGFIETKRSDTYGVKQRSLINIDSIVAVREASNVDGHYVAFIHLNDGATVETDMTYSEVISLLRKAVEDGRL